MSRLLLREYYSMCENGVCLDALTEQEKAEVKGGAMILTGILQKYDVKNGNGRIYTKETLIPEMKNYDRLVKAKQALGELDHSEDSIVSLDRVSHMILETWWKGNEYWGKIRVLDTPRGKTLRSLIEGGCQLGISSRGLGNLTEGEDGAQIVDSYECIAYDIVSNPSTPGAFVHPVQINESLYKQYRQSLSKSDRIYRCLNKILMEN